MRTIYNVPHKITPELENILHYMNDLLHDRDQLRLDLADANGATDMMSEDIDNLRSVINKLRKDIQLISENK